MYQRYTPALVLLVAAVAGIGCISIGLAHGQGVAAKFDRDLKLGDTGSDVSALQVFLIGKGLLTVPNPTGYFGAKTAAALANWQGSLGLPSTGYFGPLSRVAIGSASSISAD